MDMPKTENAQEETIQDIQNYLDTFNKDMRPPVAEGEEDEEAEEEQDELFGNDPEEERIFFTDEHEDGEGSGVVGDGGQERSSIDAPAATEYQTVVLPQGVDSGEMSYVLIVQPTETDEGHEDVDGENIGVYEFNEQEGDANKTPIQSEEDEQDEKKGIVKVVRARGSQANTPQHMCSYCSYSTPKRYLLARHLKSHSEERPHKCSVCERGFKTQASLQNHVNTHTGTKPHQCKYCEGSFTTSGELVRHIRYRHTLEKPHRCTECDYSSVELSKLKRHMRCHTGERPYQCPHCTYASPDTFKLKRHLRIHTGEKPYECDICLARFTQSNSLKSHKLIHTGNKPVFQCELCPTTCGRKTDLRIHVQKLHTSEKPVKCKRCSRSFPDRYTYKLHSKSHDGEKCFRCDLCPYASTTARHLESHMLVHTDQKPFNCEQCNQSFRQKQLLRRHVNLYHNPHYTPPAPAMKVHQCPICLKQFRHKGNLLRHIACHETDGQGMAIGSHKKFKVEVPEEVDELMALEGQDGQQYVVLEVIELQEGEEEEDEEELEEDLEEYEGEELEETKASGIFGDSTASQSDEQEMEETVVGQDETSLSAITDFDSMLVPAPRATERRSLPISADLSKERDTCFGFDDDDE